MSARIIVGLAGYAQSGKDTTADVLVNEYGFIKLSFADPLRKIAAAINPIVSKDDDHYFPGGITPITIRYNDALNEYGYERAKKLFPEVRQFLQRLGTEGGRKVLGDTVWTDTWLRAVDATPRGTRIVATDVRFPNEASTVFGAGGKVVRVHRMNQSALNRHPSETEVDKIRADFYVSNPEFDLAAVRANAHLLAKQLGAYAKPRTATAPAPQAPKEAA